MKGREERLIRKETREDENPVSLQAFQERKYKKCAIRPVEGRSPAMVPSPLAAITRSSA